MNIKDIIPENILRIEDIRKWESQGCVFFPTRTLLDSPTITPPIKVAVSTWVNILHAQRFAVELLRLSMEEGKPTVIEKVVHAFEQVFDDEGYLLVLPGEDFVDDTIVDQDSQLYLKTEQAQPILVTYRITNPRQLLADLGVTLYTYDQVN